MANYNLNDALIALRLEVFGAEQIKMAAQATERMSAAATKLKPAEQVIRLRIEDTTVAGLRIAEANMNRYTQLVVEDMKRIQSAIASMSSLMGRSGGGMNIAANYIGTGFGIQPETLLDVANAQRLYSTMTRLNRVLNTIARVGDIPSELEDQANRYAAKINRWAPGIIGSNATPIARITDASQPQASAQLARMAFPALVARDLALLNTSVRNVGIPLGGIYSGSGMGNKEFTALANIIAQRGGLYENAAYQSIQRFGTQPGEILGSKIPLPVTLSRSLRNRQWDEFGPGTLVPYGWAARQRATAGMLFGGIQGGSQGGPEDYMGFNPFEEDAPMGYMGGQPFPLAIRGPHGLVLVNRLPAGGGRGGGFGGGLPPGIVGGNWNVEGEGTGGGGGSMLSGPGIPGLGRFGQRFAGLGYYMAAAAIIYPMAASIYESISNAAKLEVEMKKIQGIYGAHTLGEQLAIRQDIVTNAQRFSESMLTVAEATQQFAQEQIPLERMSEFIGAAAMTSKAFGINMKEAADYIIAIENATGGQIGPQRAVNLIGALATRGAVSPQNLMTAMQQMGPMMEQFAPGQGGPLEEMATVGAITAFASRYARLSGAQVGNALKFMIARFGSGQSLSKIQDISGVNLGTQESGGEELRSFVGILTDLSNAYNELLNSGRSGQAAELLKDLFGARQVGAGAVILRNWTNELRLANNAIHDSATLSAMAKMQTDAWLSASTRLKNHMTDLGSSLLSAAKPQGAELLDFLSDVAGSIQSVIDKMRELESHHYGQIGGGGAAIGLRGYNIQAPAPKPPATLEDIARTFLGRKAVPPALRAYEQTLLPPPGGTGLSGEPSARAPGPEPNLIKLLDITHEGEMTRENLGAAAERMRTQINMLRRLSQIKHGPITPLDAYLQTIETARTEYAIGLVTQRASYENQVEAAGEAYPGRKMIGPQRNRPNQQMEDYDKEIHKLTLANELQQDTLDNKYKQTLLDAQSALYTQQQEDHYKNINEELKKIQDNIAKALSAFPGALSAARGGLGGNMRNIHPLSVFAESVLFPFGEEQFQASMKKGAAAFGPGGFLQSVGKFLAGSKPTINEKIAAADAKMMEKQHRHLTQAEKDKIISDETKADLISAGGQFVGATLGSSVGGSGGGAQTGASLGALAGNAIGPSVGLPPGVGGAIGGMLGGLIGGFIGPKPHGPPQVNHLQIIADNSREQVRLLTNTNQLLSNNLISFNVPTGFRLPSYQPSLFGGVGVSRGGGGVNNNAINVSVSIGRSNISANEIGTQVAQAIADRLELEARSAGTYSPRLIYG